MKFCKSPRMTRVNFLPEVLSNRTSQIEADVYNPPLRTLPARLARDRRPMRKVSFIGLCLLVFRKVEFASGSGGFGGA
jgi:hypothetical protein